MLFYILFGLMKVEFAEVIIDSDRRQLGTVKAIATEACEVLQFSD
jgi:hypothetical protein